jgi:RNA polymerase sigma-70 factor (ECF subfamily)
MEKTFSAGGQPHAEGREGAMITEPQPATDLALVERAQAGNDAAFDELMARYKKPILNFVYRMLKDAEEADDVAQDVFVRVYRKLGTFKPDLSRVDATKVFSTWLFAVANHAAIDRLRWRKRHPTSPLSELPDGATTSRHDVITEASAHELGEQISTAVARLPQDQQTALILCEYNGLSYAEAAQIMKSSIKSVELRLYRAKRTLREILKSVHDDFGRSQA